MGLTPTFISLVLLSYFDFVTGFAFVYFEDDRDAEDAIRGLDNEPFGYDRRKLSVEWAKVIVYCVLAYDISIFFYPFPQCFELPSSRNFRFSWF